MVQGRRISVVVGGLLLGSAALAGCTNAPAGHPPVPAVLSEQVPEPPRSQTVMIWQPGHWNWTGSAYQWITGEWVERAGHGTLWQDGYWRGGGVASTWGTAHWL